MRTDKLWVNGSIRRNDEVNEILHDFAAAAKIAGKDFQHMTLLTEETLEMANNLVKNFDGEIWLRTTSSGYEIILEADVRANDSSRPEAASGFMAKIAEMLNCSYMFEDVDEMPERLAELLPDYMSYGAKDDRQSTIWAGSWSLSSYRDNLQRHRNEKGKEVALEELEKSIVANLADDVTIGICGRRIRMVISGRVEARCST